MVLKRNRCLKCKHVWLPRKKQESSECPKCQCIKWDQQPSMRITFDFGQIEIGQELLYPWFEVNGRPQNHMNIKIVRALIAYSHRSGRVFKRAPTPRGLQVIRIS